MRVNPRTLSRPVAGQDSVKPKGMPDNPELLTFRQVHEELHRKGVPLCGYTIRRRVKDGTIKAIKTPYRLLFQREHVARWIADLKAKP